MRAIMVMFDSLNRHYLPPYGCDATIAPNFRRLAQRAVTFDRSYVCSMPCMPARRDLHTGRPNFLHNSWGPLEPFDDSMPALLSKTGTSTHLITDHYHYFEDGGGTYHNRYDTWEFFRGQEGDPCIGLTHEPHTPPNLNQKGRRQDWVNRQFIKADVDYSQTKTFDAGVRFIERNHADDNWFLQIECFDPHEPFTTPRHFRDLYPSDYDGPVYDWPGYGRVTESPEAMDELRRNYRALLTKCDESLGHVLDMMDAHDMWRDTMLILWTDHGFLLGEHDCLAKSWPPLFEPLSHTPFFVYDPRHPQTAGQRRSALVQPAIDLAPTLLNFFGQPPTPDMLGHDLGPVIQRDTPVRDAAMFGYHNQRVNITDGRYVYYRRPRPEQPGDAFSYTLMPTRMRSFLDLRHAEQAEPFSFTKQLRPLKVPGRSAVDSQDNWPDLLFDLQNDPQQEKPIQDAQVVAQLEKQLAGLMRAADAPAEQFARLNLSPP